MCNRKRRTKFEFKIFAPEPGPFVDPGPVYQVAGLAAFSRCLSIPQQTILELSGVDPGFLEALPEDMVMEQVGEIII
jgi:hypothetical protein